MKSKFEQALLANNLLYEEEESFSSLLLPIIKYDLELTRRGNLNYPEPSVAFIDEPTLNAFATKYEDEYCIGINIGTVIILADIFSKILATKNVFTNHGNHLVEVGVLPLGDPHITDASFIYSPNYPYKGIQPIDPERSKLALALTVLAVRFLALHEYGHIVNGHVDYKDSLNLGFRFDEAPQPSKPRGISPLDSQTLELDADAFATKAGLSLLLNSKSYLHQGAVFGIFDKNLHEAVNLWSSAVAVLFRLFGNIQSDSTNLAENDYPVGRARLIVHTGLIAQLLANHSSPALKKLLGIESLSMEDIMEWDIQHLAWIEHAFAAMSYPELAKTSAQNVLEQLSMPYHENYSATTKNWSTLRPNLLPFAKGNLAPG